MERCQVGPHPDLKNLALTIHCRVRARRLFAKSALRTPRQVEIHTSTSRRTSTPTRSVGFLESTRGLGNWEPDPPLRGNPGSTRKGPTLLQRFEDLRAEVHHAMTINSVTGMPNGFAEPDRIRSRLSGMVVALSEQASELAALRRKVEILRERTHLVPTEGKTGRQVRASSTGSLGRLGGNGSLGVHEHLAPTTLLLKPKNSSLGKNLGSLDSLLDPVTQGLQLDKVRKTKDDTIVVSLPTKRAAKTLQTFESLTSLYDIEESSTLMPQLRLGNVDSSFDKDRVLAALRTPNLIQNQELQSAASTLRLCGRMGPKGGNICTWVVAAHPKVWRFLVSKGHAYIESNKCPVMEYNSVPRCYLCHGYGHLAKYCRIGACCRKCGSKGHARGSCTEKAAICVPCARKGHKRTHSRAVDCPVYAAVLRKARERIPEDLPPADAT